MLRYLFVDMDSYFASVEQQERPETRGRPVAVAATAVETTCCIAASYEAKRHGVRTGTVVHEARRLCPGLQLIEARPRLYVEYHQRIVQAVESCLHVEQVCSVDEMWGRLYANERAPERAASIAHNVKDAIREAAGEYVRCSVGLAPNVWLSKVATDLQKPDGLTMIRPEDLPAKLCRFELTDLPGIARRMLRRLNAHGVRSIEQFYQCSEAQLATIWGSRILGSVWHSQLRGHDLPERPTRRRTVGHSHVLPPAHRSDAGVYAGLVRMIHKAAARLRRLGHRAGSLTVSIEYLDGGQWERRASLGHCRDTLSMLRALAWLWPGRPTGTPAKAAVVLAHLVPDSSAEQPLFAEQARLDGLSDAMDAIDARYGPLSVYAGAMLGAEDTAPVRISYTQIPSLDEFG